MITMTIRTRLLLMLTALLVGIPGLQAQPVVHDGAENLLGRVYLFLGKERFRYTKIDEIDFSQGLKNYPESLNFTTLEPRLIYPRQALEAGAEASIEFYGLINEEGKLITTLRLEDWEQNHELTEQVGMFYDSVREPLKELRMQEGMDRDGLTTMYWVPMTAHFLIRTAQAHDEIKRKFIDFEGLRTTPFKPNSKSNTRYPSDLTQPPKVTNIDPLRREMKLELDRAHTNLKGMVMLKVLISSVGQLLYYRFPFSSDFRLRQIVEARIERLAVQPGIDQGKGYKAWIEIPIIFK